MRGFKTAVLSYLEKKRETKIKFNDVGIGYYWNHRTPNPDTHSIFGLEKATCHGHLIFKEDGRRIIVVKTHQTTKEHTEELNQTINIDSIIHSARESVKFYPKEGIPKDLARRIVEVPDIEALKPYMDRVITEDDVPILEKYFPKFAIKKFALGNSILGFNQSMLVINSPQFLVSISYGAMARHALKEMTPLMSYLRRADYLRPASS